VSTSAGPLEAHLRTHPQDRDAWLVYADWLSDQGDVRGRLILLEHQQQAQPALQAELDALRAQHQSEWGLPGLSEDAQYEWRHGFVVGVRLPWSAETLDLLPGLLSHPEGRLLTSLRLRHEPDGAEDDGEDYEYDDPREEYDGGDEEEEDPERAELFQRFSSLDLGQLTSLDLAYSGLEAEIARALARSTHLGGLRSLDLRLDRLGNKGAAALAEARLDSLVSLHLQSNRIGPDGARALASSSHLQRLELLDLRDNPIGPAGAEALARSPVVSRLTSLYLHRGDIGTDGARALAESERLPLPLRRYWKAQ
jgi:uncharacterized protein (TIGR02996 family)